jgi:hypothetical protein
MSPPVWRVYNRYASPRSNRPAVRNIDLDAIWSIQLIVGLLSHSVIRVWCLMTGASSKMTPTAITYAASSKSELVMDPVGLFLEITLSVIS